MFPPLLYFTGAPSREAHLRPCTVLTRQSWIKPRWGQSGRGEWAWPLAGEPTHHTSLPSGPPATGEASASPPGPARDKLDLWSSYFWYPFPHLLVIASYFLAPSQLMWCVWSHIHSRFGRGKSRSNYTVSLSPWMGDADQAHDLSLLGPRAIRYLFLPLELLSWWSLELPAELS